MNPNVVYAHGFASSVHGQKIAYLRERLAPHGVTLHAIDMNRPSFEELTLTAQVDALAAFIDGLALDRPPLLIGSSMGGLVSLLLSERRPAVAERLLLLAPAFQFVGEHLASLAGSSLTEWRERGWIPVVHPSDGAVHQVGYQLHEDAARYDFAALGAPAETLVVHGTADEVIPHELSERWVARHPRARLASIPDGDHQLGGHLPELWAVTRDFLLG